MNIFKKFYCRTFQTIFRLAIPLLPYREPKLLNSNQEVADTLSKNNISKVLLVSDKGIRGLGLTLNLEKALSDNNIQFEIFDDVVPNPTTDNVEQALAIYKSTGCQGLIAFGGGSVMDCAKAVGARVVKPKKTLAKMKGVMKVRKRLPLLVAVPTTAGTGSETIIASVITDNVTRHK